MTSSFDTTTTTTTGLARCTARRLERVRALPGVRSAAWSANIPLGRTIRSLVVPEETPTEPTKNEPDWIQVDSDIVTPGFLRTMGFPLLQGRDFTDRDDFAAPGVVMVNETMARTYWPGSNAIGKRVRVFSRQTIRHDVYEVVGIVRDAKYRNLWEEPRPFMLFSARATSLSVREPARSHRRPADGDAARGARCHSRAR